MFCAGERQVELTPSRAPSACRSPEACPPPPMRRREPTSTPSVGWDQTELLWRPGLRRAGESQHPRGYGSQVSGPES